MMFVERRIIKVILLLCLIMYCIAFPYKEVLECNGSVCSVEANFIIPPISAITDYEFQQQAIIADYKRNDDTRRYTTEVLSLLGDPDELLEWKWRIYELNLKERFGSFNRQGRLVSYKFNRDDTFCINTFPQARYCRVWYMMMKKDRVLSTFYLYWTYDLFPGTHRRGIFISPFITIDPALKILNMLESDKEHFKVTKYCFITKFDDK